ncbi:MAG TPA: Vms1/Ankzf1 family peptidyl-tRNA hydrolase [archaeon]|nr:Vms1/Ankzf1 family peptidyl-tRNA hydrolase [archaeon]
MLKKIFGKKEQDYINSLEAQLKQLILEKDSITARLEAKEEIARKAVSQKQVVEEELNAANKKIETLEYELSKMRQKKASELNFRNISNISRQAMNRYLFQISSIRAMENSLITVYLKSGESLSHLDNSNDLIDSLGLKNISFIDKMESSTGIVVFYDTNQMIQEAVVPFLPLESSSWKLENSFDTAPLQNLIEKEVNLLILLIHAGESFIGITGSPDSFTSHQIVRSSVKGKHTKGGWSQHRFEKLRDEDIQHHLEKVSGALHSMVKESSIEIDFIVAVGDSRLVFETLKDFNYPLIERSLDVSVDKKNVDKILKEIWSSKRYEI